MDKLPEIIFASSDPVESRRITQWRKAGRIRLLIPRVYTSNDQDAPEVIVRRNLWILLSALFPNALVSHRTALEHKISPKGNIYLNTSARRVYKWPGVNIRLAQGPEALDTDLPCYDNLKVSSFERACLENLSPSRMEDGERRTVEQSVLESRLLDVLYARGEAGLNKVRDQTAEIAQLLDMQREQRKLDQLIGELLSTRPAESLVSGEAKAQASGLPYDIGRIELFHELAAALRSRTFAVYAEKTESMPAFQNLAFFEAYFSNYIEGTTFLVEEARQIVYEEAVIPLRTADAHDIRGTYELCADRREMERIPTTPEKLLHMLRYRHSILMGGRPDKNPGSFKSKSNRAGNTIFVDPEFLEGTLREGHKLYVGLADPVARALFIMFMISEVHPFEDGNGRIARLMMNAELVHAGYTKIIIPTSNREDYLDALRRLSRKRDPELYIQFMMRSIQFSHELDPGDYNSLQLQLERAKAFDEVEDGQ